MWRFLRPLHRIAIHHQSKPHAIERSSASLLQKMYELLQVQICLPVTPYEQLKTKVASVPMVLCPYSDVLPGDAERTQTRRNYFWDTVTQTHGHCSSRRNACVVSDLIGQVSDGAGGQYCHISGDWCCAVHSTCRRIDMTGARWCTTGGMPEVQM